MEKVEDKEFLYQQIKSCQILIYEGFKSTQTSGLSWLGVSIRQNIRLFYNDISSQYFCELFSNFCSSLHKTMLSDWPNKDSIESVFLCLMQTTTCVKYLENSIFLEEKSGKVLSESRQHFLDRILWCLSRLKTLIVERKMVLSQKDHNFVELMDISLDLIAPYSDFSGGSVVNIAEFNAAAMFDSKKVRQVVDLLLGQTLSYANVTMPKDKKVLGALCQIVLKACMSFEKECLLDKDLNENERCLQVGFLYCF